MTRKVINPPRAVPTTSSTTCPTCGSHPQSQAYTLPDPASTTGSVGITEDDPWVRKYSELSPEFSSLLAGRFLDQEHLMGLSYNVYLNSDKIFGCKNCKTHLASHDTIISRVSVLLPNTSDLYVLPVCVSSPAPLLFTPFSRPRQIDLSLIPSFPELPRPTRQSLPLQHRREYHPIRSSRAQHDHRPPPSAGRELQAVQRDGGLEVRQSL